MGDMGIFSECWILGQRPSLTYVNGLVAFNTFFSCEPGVLTASLSSILSKPKQSIILVSAIVLALVA